jgi:hypothetical protein
VEYVIVVVIVLALTAVGVVLYLRRGGADAREHREAQHQLTKQHKAATKSRATAIRTAEKRVTIARSSYEAAVRELERELAALRTPDGRRLGAYQGITLHELSVSTPQGKSSLIGATAAVDTAGNLAVTRRATLTRTVAGGVLFGPVGALIGGAGFKKKTEHDSRELYLMVETTSLVAVVKCPPDHGPQARSFAAKIQTAAKHVQQIAADRPRRINDVEMRLAAVRNDTKSVEGAERSLAEANADPVMLATIEHTRRALEDHASRAPQRKLPPA